MGVAYKSRPGASRAQPAAKSPSGCGCGSADPCTCGVCDGLQNLNYPRHFAGQLLTEAELNGTLDYVKAKNRLHNRYLHGWGVVCGLQVACSECDGYVTVHPGYALDPCGNDILAPDEQDVPLLEMIKACREARRKRAAPCDPIKPAGKANCDDKEEQWCLAIRFEEQDCRPVTPLRNPPAKTCSCGGNAKGTCGCGNTATGAAGARRSALPSIACEPTRVCETYRFDVVESADCCLPQTTPIPRLPPIRTVGLGRAALGDVAPAALALGGWLVDSLKCADLDNTLFKRVSDCLKSIAQFVLKRTGLQTVAPLAYVLAGGKGKIQYNAVHIYNAQQSLYQAVLQLYTQNPLNVRCSLGDQLKLVSIHEIAGGETSASYVSKSTVSTHALLALIVQYALDCVCQNLMPPCPENPCDDRVILACVTLKNDRIVSICDFGCRRYAGSFPAMSYWLSAVPIVPVLEQLVKNICCTDLLAKRPARKPTAQPAAQPAARPIARAAMLSTAGGGAGADAGDDTSPFINQLDELFKSLDPDGSLRAMLFADHMAAPQQWASQLRRRIGGAPLPDWRLGADVDLDSLRQRSPDLAHATLKDAGVRVVAREVASSDALARANLTATAAGRGDTVVMYTLEGRVAGFAPYDADEKLADRQAEVDALKNDMAELRADLQRLRRARGSGAA
ncbi:MAG: hypothetical protein HZB53_06255 [Chloroflexi bacterium]|nr:hypothetical protein [Chloroflexota bacterium]